MGLDESILTSIKQMLGITEEAKHFDNELISNINATFMSLNQIGVGSDDGFHITGYDETWSQFVDDIRLADPARQYIAMKVRLIFDPPGSSIAADAFNQRIAEVEWRLNVLAEKLAAQAEEGAAGS